jgi:ribonuclease HI
LKSVFKIEEIGDAKWILGIKVEYDKANGIMKLSQQAYIEKILKRFEIFDNARAKHDTPAIKHPLLDSTGLNTKFPYLEAVGSLMYLAISTRPDIRYAVDYVAQRSSNPSDRDVRAVKRIFRYLRGTMELGLIYRRVKENNAFKLQIYTDAAFDVNENSKSQTGYLIKLGDCTIYATSKKQPIIAQSSCEAEYIAMTEASNECIAIRYLLKELLSNSFNDQITLYTDSQAAIQGANSIKPSSIRHINRRLNVIKDRIANGILHLIYLETTKQIADMLTKPLDRFKFVELREKLLGYG